MEKKIKIGIVGCGSIGASIARFVERDICERCVLSAIFDKKEDKTDAIMAALASSPKILPLSDLIDETDLIIESASIEGAKEVIENAVPRDKDVVIISVGAFVIHQELLDLVTQSKSNVYIPSGAIAGVDGISSLSQRKIKKVILTTRKPPRSLAGVKFLEDEGVDVFSIKEEVLVFSGNIRDAVKCFPKNINVAATLFLASRCKDILVNIKVDPALERNVHRIEVVADEANINVEVENFPSPDNPKTSYLTILSVENLLKKIVSGIKIGS